MALTRRSSLAIGLLIVVSSGILFVVPPRLWSAGVLLLAGSFFAAAGTLPSDSTSRIEWWQLNGVGLLCVVVFAWAYTLEIGAMQIPPLADLVTISLVLASVALVASGVDLLAGGKYIFPDLGSDPE